MSYDLQNFYKTTLLLDWTIGTGNFYVTTLPTISTGWLVISPNNSTLREIVKYSATGTDGTGNYITVITRGVGGTSEQTHSAGEPIRMNITAEYWASMQDDIDSIVAAGTSNANTTTRGIVEEATAAEIDAGTQTGSTGAELFINPKLLNDAHNIPLVAPGTSGNILESNGTDWTSVANTAKKYTVGALDNALVKTYFNVQLPFILWTGSTSGAATTDFSNWVRSSTDVAVSPGGAMLDFQNAGQDSIYLEAPFRVGASDNLQYDNTNIVIMDWWAKLPASGTGDIQMGFGSENNSFNRVYNSTTSGAGITFTQRGSTGVIYATMSEEGVGVTNTDVSSGVTVTNWNNYRIELDLGTDAKYYINGTLVATLSGVNLEVNNVNVWLGFGRSDTSLFQVTAPNMSLQMNP